MLTTYQKQAKIKLTMTVIALVVIAGVIMLTDAIKPKSRSAARSVATTAHTTPTVSQTAVATSSPTGSPSTNTQPAATPSTSTTPVSATTSSNYRDGAYSASADYYVPHSNENIKVSLTLSNGVITNASIQNSEGDPTSASYQQDFASIYKSSVVGQKISGLQLGIIGGASDTTQGFNDALSQIAAKAQA